VGNIWQLYNKHIGMQINCSPTLEIRWKYCMFVCCWTTIIM